MDHALLTTAIKSFLIPATAVLALSLSACLTTGPNSATLPQVDGGESYQHGSPGSPIPAAGDWWKRFNDAGLNELISRSEAANPGLQAALARYDKARAALGLAQADRFPSITGDALWQRKRDTASGVFVPETLTYSQYRAALNLDYEIDLWGRVRHSVAAAEADFAASAADLAGATLSLKAELARTWFQFRASSEEIALVKETLQLREKNLSLVSARVDGGEANQLDLARAQTELESTRALLLQLQRESRATEHALAFLVGSSPSHFTTPDVGGPLRKASIPSGVPSELLARRPDIAAAEARVHAAAERLGVVKASYLPRITLGGSGGLSSLDLAKLFDAKSLFGEIGPSVQIPIFQGGRSKSDRLRIEAGAREALANYREVVLDAFREVETALSDASYLEGEIGAHQRAASAAEKAASLARERYTGGLSSYLEVIDAERTALDERRELTRSRTSRQLAAVTLVQALGGGWTKP